MASNPARVLASVDDVLRSRRMPEADDLCFLASHP
jgi:hypothetical protein